MRMRGMWPFRHVGLKLLSVAIAVLLWMVIAGEETVERGLRVPLELQQFPAGLELLGDVPTTADVRVRGASGTLSRVSPGEIVAVLDLRSAKAGERLFHLTPDQVRVPFGVEVVQVSPPTVAVAFEKAASRNVPIKPAIDGKPAAGYVVGKITTDPQAVDVVGPESAVLRVVEALTEPLSIAGAVGPVQETVTVGTLDSAVRLRTQRTAKVTVQIVPAPLEQTVRDRPVHLRNVPANLMATVVPSKVDVTLRGSREALSRIKPDEATAFVDLTGLGAGEYMLTVYADSSRDAGVARIEPPAIQVRITSARD
jgi:YbbR domain-containing protein